MLLPILLDMPPLPTPVAITAPAPKRNRDIFPSCRNWEADEPRPAGCRRKSTPDPRAEFPDNRRGTGGPVPRAPRK